jgi:hypothetical protein
MKPHPILAAVREIWIMEETESLDCKIMGEFAARYSLAFEIDTSTITPIIVGSNGQIFCYSDVPPMLGVAWCPDELSSEQWTGTIRKMLRLGFSVVRDCASESVSSVGIANPDQASVALALCQATPAPDSVAQNAEMCSIITKARARKLKHLNIHAQCEG